MVIFAASDTSGLVGIDCDSTGIRFSSAFGNTGIWKLCNTNRLISNCYTMAALDNGLVAKIRLL
jgi:hypothetical protein